MTAEIIECTSRVERVVVYARGAIVTRRVEIAGPLPRGAVEIAVPGVTPLAEPGSFRAIVASAAAPAEASAGAGAAAREVVGVRARLVVPPAPVATSSLAARLRELELTIERLSAEQSHLRSFRDLLGSVSLAPELARRFRPVDPAARIQDALAVSGLLSAELAALDARSVELDTALSRARREQEALQLDAAQAASADVEERSPPRLDVAVRLAPARDGADEAPAPPRAGGGPALLVEYAVLAARWWPAYAARFSRGATQVDWQLDAFVAQASGEDWRDVQLALSTADLVQDTRLPELASLRLSRAQRPRRRGYRPAPEGLDAMFEGFDRFVATLPPPARTAPEAGADTLAHARRSRGASAPAAPLPVAPAPVAPAPVPPAPVAPSPAAPAPSPPPVPAMAPPPAMVAAPQGALPARARSIGLRLPSFGAALEAFAGSPGAPASYGAPAPLQSAQSAAPRSASSAEDTLSFAAFLEGEEAQDRGAEPAASIEPAEAWLDFDALELTAAGPQRGRLVRHDPGRQRRGAAQAQAAIDGLEAPPRAVDPRASRGQFDHLYASDGTADVPSNGRPHRVALSAARAAAAPRFVTVPREAAEVYREARVENPFAAPLLAGPVDVFIDGALAAQSAIGYVDRGGVIRTGLGVEERIRVARNARVDESSAGLLGGSLAVEHAITIDLSSSLGAGVDVEVIDRIPVTDDKDVEIKLLSSQPKAEPYTQEDIGEPVRGGLRWRVPIAPGGKASLAFTYRVVLSSKNEVVGGNRRE